MLYLKKNDYPKPYAQKYTDSGTWVFTNTVGLFEMYNREFYAFASFQPNSGSSTHYIVIYNADGSIATTNGVEKKCLISSLPVSGSVLGIENDGSKYIIFMSNSTKNNYLYIFSTTDFVTFSSVQELSVGRVMYTGSISASYPSQVIYDGYYYYIVGQKASDDYQYVIQASNQNSTFVKNSEYITCSGSGYYGHLSVCRTDTNNTVFLFQNSNGYGYAYWFDTTGTRHNIYTGNSNYPYDCNYIVEFNDDYYIAWTSGSEITVIFIDKSTKTQYSRYTFSSVNGLLGTMSADKNNFLVYYYSSSYNILQQTQISTSSNSPWSSSARKTNSLGYYYSSNFSNSWYYNSQRSADAVLISSNTMDYIIKTKALPFLPSNECYNYIKIRE